jgi:phage gp36-like protein
MPYCTLTDIKKLIPEASIIQLTDDENTGAVVTSRVDEAIAQADAEIDSYCGNKYSVPFSTVPDIVKKCSVDISIYNLYSRRVEEIPATRADRYKNATRQLEGISKGIISIGEDPEPAAPTQGGVETNKTESDRVFTRDSLKGF